MIGGTILNTKGRAILLTGGSLTGMGIAAVEMSERHSPEKAMYLVAKSINDGVASAITYLESSQTSVWDKFEYFDIIKETVNPQEYKFFVLDNVPEIVRSVRWEYRTDSLTDTANKVIELINDLAVYVTGDDADIVILTSEDIEFRSSENEREVLEMVNHSLGKMCDEAYFYVSGRLLKMK